MNITQVIDNLYLAESAEFGNFNKEVVHSLLANVHKDFKEILGANLLPKNKCLIVWHDKDYPMCSRHSDDLNIIYLSVCQDYWCQWIFQFAHEYCHHIIGGPLTGTINGITWFEEVLCHVSSLYNLYKMKNFCLASTNHLNLHHYSQAVLDYLDANKEPPLPVDWQRDWLPQLSQPIYQRELYNQIAYALLPLFLDNPALWKILTLLGDSEQWDSLESFYNYILSNADPLYNSSLSRLHNVLFS